MPHHSASSRSGLLAIHLVAFLFGMTGILGSLIEADPGTITFGRAAFAVLTLTPLLLLPQFQPRDKQHFKTSTTQKGGAVDGVAPSIGYTLLSGTLLAVHWITFFYSVKIAGVALATLGFSSFAAFITVIEWVISRQISRTDWLRTLGVTMGLVLMTPSWQITDQSTYGFLMGLASGLSFAAMAVVNSRKLAQNPPMLIARNQNLIVALLLLPLAWPHLRELSATSWLWLSVLGILCTGLSHSLFVYSLKRLRVNMAGLVVALEPVYAIAVAWLLFAQTPEPRTLIGGVLIVGSILGVSAATATRQASAGNSQ